MIIIFTLIVLDWLYLAWLKLRSICFKLGKALFPRHYNNNEEVWLPPELWVELLKWMPPKQLVNCQQANARLRDIVDRHRAMLPRQIKRNYKAALNAIILSLHIDNVLISLAWILYNCSDIEYTTAFMFVFFSTAPTFIIRTEHDDHFLLKFGALVNPIWPRHSKLIVRICGGMDKFYDWISSKHFSDCLIKFVIAIVLIMDIGYLILWLCKFVSLEFFYPY